MRAPPASKGSIVVAMKPAKALLGFLLAGYVRLGQAVEETLVQCLTTKGPILIDVHIEWAPLGASRFLELVDNNFYTDIALFRCVDGFLTQFGISEDKEKAHWHGANIEDDPNLQIGIKKSESCDDMNTHIYITALHTHYTHTIHTTHIHTHTHTTHTHHTHPLSSQIICLMLEVALTHAQRNSSLLSKILTFLVTNHGRHRLRK